MNKDIILKNSGGSVSPREYSPLALAFIGDAAYELYIRTRVLSEANASANTLHKRCVGFVNCRAQCDAVTAFSERLTEDELAVYKRGRNAKTPTVPKNAGVGEYHAATGFEALIGWLYLSGAEERACEIMDFVYNFIVTKGC